MADLEHGVRLTPQSVFYMASVSKQFMALSILLLERDGKLQLEDRVQTYVPELPPYAAAITIRQLLHHTSGLRDYLTLSALAGNPPDHVITERGVLTRWRGRCGSTSNLAPNICTATPDTSCCRSSSTV